MKIVKRIFFWLISVLLILLLVFNVLTLFLNQKFKDVFVDKLTQNLQTNLYIRGQVYFSFIENFPNATIHFSDVTIEGRIYNEQEPLLEAHTVQISFNIWELLLQQYNIKEVLIEQGQLNLYEDQYGVKNYEILILDEPIEKENNEVNINLDNLQLNNIRVHYAVEREHIDIRMKIDHSILSGDFSSKEYNMRMQCNAFSDNLMINDIDYLKEKEIQLELMLDVTDEDNVITYKFKKNNIQVNKEAFQVTGTIQDSKIDLIIQDKQGDLSALISLLPPDYSTFLSGISSNGIFSLAIALKGDISKQHGLGYEAKFALKDGIIRDDSSGFTLTDVQLLGTVNNGKDHTNQSSVAELQRLKAKMNQLPIDVSFKILNFEEPLLIIKANGALDMQYLSTHYMPHEMFDRGTVELDDINIVAKGKKKDNKSTISYKIKNANGNLNLNHIQVQTDWLDLQKLYGSIGLANENINLKNIKIEAGKTKVGLNAIIPGGTSYLTDYIFEKKKKKEPLYVKGALSSSNFNLNNFLSQLKSIDSITQKNTDLDKEQTPFSYEAELSVAIDQFQYDSMILKKIGGKVNILPNRIRYDSLQFLIANGKASASGILELDSVKTTLKSIVLTENVDIRECFYMFDNFGQRDITDQNIRGKLDATTHFSMQWDSKGDFIYDSLYMLSNISIRDGELLAYKPIQKLATFVKLKDLRHLQFSEVSNQIEIKNQVIEIPTTPIVSNAMTVSITGKHTFDHEIDYKFKINMSKLIANRLQKENPSLEEFEEETSGKLNLFLSMTGTVDDPIIKYDKKVVKAKLEEDLKQEKKELLKVLKDEIKNDYQPNESDKDWEDEDELEFIDFTP